MSNKNTRYQVRISKEPIFWTMNSVNHPSRTLWENTYLPTFTEIDAYINWVNIFTITTIVDSTDYTMIEITDTVTNEVMYFISSLINKKLTQGFEMQFVCDIYLTFGMDYYDWLVNNKIPINVNRFLNQTLLKEWFKQYKFVEQDELLNFQNGTAYLTNDCNVAVFQQTDYDYADFENGTITISGTHKWTSTSSAPNIIFQREDNGINDYDVLDGPLFHVFENTDGNYYAFMMCGYDQLLQANIDTSGFDTQPETNLIGTDEEFVNVFKNASYWIDKYIGAFVIPNWRHITSWIYLNGGQTAQTVPGGDGTVTTWYGSQNSNSGDVNTYFMFWDPKQLLYNLTTENTPYQFGEYPGSTGDYDPNKVSSSNPQVLPEFEHCIIGLDVNWDMTNNGSIIAPGRVTQSDGTYGAKVGTVNDCRYMPLSAFPHFDKYDATGQAHLLNNSIQQNGDTYLLVGYGWRNVDGTGYEYYDGMYVTGNDEQTAYTNYTQTIVNYVTNPGLYGFTMSRNKWLWLNGDKVEYDLGGSLDWDVKQSLLSKFSIKSKLFNFTLPTLDQAHINFIENGDWYNATATSNNILAATSTVLYYNANDDELNNMNAYFVSQVRSNSNIQFSPINGYFDNAYDGILTFDGIKFNMVNNFNNSTSIIETYMGTINVAINSYDEYVASVKPMFDTSLSIAQQQYSISTGKNNFDAGMNSAITLSNGIFGFFNSFLNSAGNFMTGNLTDESIMGGVQSIVNTGLNLTKIAGDAGYNNQQYLLNYQSVEKQQKAQLASARLTSKAQNIASSGTLDDAMSKLLIVNKSGENTGNYVPMNCEKVVNFISNKNDLKFIYNTIYLQGIHGNFFTTADLALQDENIVMSDGSKLNKFMYLDFMTDEQTIKLYAPNMPVGYIQALITITHNGLRIWDEVMDLTNMPNYYIDWFKAIYDIYVENGTISLPQPQTSDGGA